LANPWKNVRLCNILRARNRWYRGMQYCHLFLRQPLRNSCSTPTKRQLRSNGSTSKIDSKSDIMYHELRLRGYPSPLKRFAESSLSRPRILIECSTYRWLVWDYIR
jgi:hypothetical protein